MSDLKVTTTTTQTATEPLEQTASVDPGAEGQFQEQVRGFGEATQAEGNLNEKNEAKEQLKDLNDEIDALDAQLKDPNLPPSMKSQLRTVQNILTQKRDAIYEEYPDLKVIDSISPN